MAGPGELDLRPFNVDLDQTIGSVGSMVDSAINRVKSSHSQFNSSPNNH
jgi:hypothetical protein